ncbi:DUF4175 domain-containing protein [Lysobacter sp. MMG2]|uniref:DUF4175 domain-containing protein n=1 Tax=Lysobacter sp. MMG2 TaxID=2801338 RepID=UPI001C2106F6|nr:DUF4175 domain-containing protein [Lysobacter sp. MMG2]MBU8977616.1 DUF4175 domain-containing protein [Lysobacter sp. MMG2]
MSAANLLQHAWQQARTRRALDAIACVLPWALVASTVAWRWHGVVLASTVFVVGVVAAIAFGVQRARKLDTRWLVQRLDAARADMEDSADLLFAPDAGLTTLERLQRERLQTRLRHGAAPDLRPRWSLRAIVLSAALAMLAAAAVVFWPARPAQMFDDVVAQLSGEAAAPTHTRIVEQNLRVTPPAYTRQGARDEPTLDTRAPQGTRLQWALRLAPQPAAAELVFHDGRRVALRRDGETWRGDHVLTRSALYRLVLRDAPPLREARPHRLDAIADHPPQVRVIEPDRSLSLATPGQKRWPVVFEASDDFGVAPVARLRVTLAQGSGENITFRDQIVTLRATGGATVKRFAHHLDLGALGFAVGDDLIAQLEVEDNRTPSPQTARSASLILRWPSELGTETSDLEGMVRKVMPAYFRSQRQIIIDAEALLKDKRRLDADEYLRRSDAIGVDQRILRLRYGQFLGEEAEGEPKPPPTSDDVSAVTESDTEAAGHAHVGESAAPQDDHAHDDAKGTATFGQEGAVLEEYGHTHDHAEAATLLDPETRATLKLALDAMWQSEGHLRQGHPERALPYAYTALKHIKQVQQATRIYLARVGPELPPIDETRRMSGDRAGIARRDDALARATPPDPTLDALWRALDDTPGREAAAEVDFAALERWLRTNESRVPDPLSFIAAVDALRAQPACVACRHELRAKLWPLLPRPPAAVPRRDAGDADGRRYLDALRRETTR